MGLAGWGAGFLVPMIPYVLAAPLVAGDRERWPAAFVGRRPGGLVAAAGPAGQPAGLGPRHGLLAGVRLPGRVERLEAAAGAVPGHVPGGEPGGGRGTAMLTYRLSRVPE